LVGQVPRKEVAHLQHLKEFVKKIRTAMVRQTLMITGDS
jgi:hypothetical protein